VQKPLLNRILRARNLLLALLVLLCLQAFWWAFIFDHDRVNYHHKIKIESDKSVYALGDSIRIAVDIIAKDSTGVLRLYDNLRNVQVEVRKVVNGRLAKDTSSLRVVQYKDMPRNNALGWEKHQLKTGNKIRLMVRGIVHQGEGNTVVYDFGIHGKCVSPFYEEVVISAQVYEIFPAKWWEILGSKHAAITSNHIYIRILP
jgi:hypothetical protein